jgi:choline-sulfatase
VPYNRLYDPDRMPNPVVGDRANDHMDEQIPYMNRLIWADEIGDARARALKARYYGEITYIDDCLGRLLDAVEAREDAAHTLICFFADHGDHLGDHHAWQKESFFEASCHVPFLLSWPARLPADVRREELVCLTDLYGIAAHASRASASDPVAVADVDVRDGVDVLGLLEGSASPREAIVGMYGEPGTPQFKVMVRDRRWKYIYLANGEREQLFDLVDDPHELANRIADWPEVGRRMRERAIVACGTPGAADALDGGRLRGFPFRAREAGRIYQFDRSRGVIGFPERPQDVLDACKPA